MSSLPLRRLLIFDAAMIDVFAALMLISLRWLPILIYVDVDIDGDALPLMANNGIATRHTTGKRDAAMPFHFRFDILPISCWRARRCRVSARHAVCCHTR